MIGRSDFLQGDMPCGRSVAPTAANVNRTNARGHAAATPMHRTQTE